MSMLTFTENAKRKILQQSAGRIAQGSPFHLRLAVRGGGCSGLKYELKFDNPSEDDLTEEIGEQVLAIVDPKSAILLSGSTVEFHDDLNQSGFEIQNPNARNGCGCKKSFGV